MGKMSDYAIEQQDKVLSMVEENKLSTWAGEPCDARGDFTKNL